MAGQPRSLGAERLPIIFIIPIISRLRRGPNHGQDGDIGLDDESEKMMKLFPSYSHLNFGFERRLFH